MTKPKAYCLLACNPVAGYGIFEDGHDLYQFDAVSRESSPIADDDAKVLFEYDSEMHELGTEFETEDALITWVRLQYLRFNKGSLYATLVQRQLSDTGRKDLLELLDDTEFTNLPIFHNMVESLREHRNPTLVLEALELAVAQGHANVKRCLATELADVTFAPAVIDRLNGQQLDLRQPTVEALAETLREKDHLPGESLEAFQRLKRTAESAAVGFSRDLLRTWRSLFAVLPLPVPILDFIDALASRQVDHLTRAFGEAVLESDFESLAAAMDRVQGVNWQLNPILMEFGHRLRDALPTWEADVRLFESISIRLKQKPWWGAQNTFLEAGINAATRRPAIRPTFEGTPAMELHVRQQTAKMGREMDDATLFWLAFYADPEGVSMSALAHLTMDGLRTIPVSRHHLSYSQTNLLSLAFLLPKLERQLDISTCRTWLEICTTNNLGRKDRVYPWEAPKNVLANNILSWSLHRKNLNLAKDAAEVLKYPLANTKQLTPFIKIVV